MLLGHVNKLLILEHCSFLVSFLMLFLEKNPNKDNNKKKQLKTIGRGETPQFLERIQLC